MVEFLIAYVICMLVCPTLFALALGWYLTNISLTAQRERKQRERQK